MFLYWSDSKPDTWICLGRLSRDRLNVIILRPRPPRAQEFPRILIPPLIMPRPPRPRGNKPRAAACNWKNEVKNFDLLTNHYWRITQRKSNLVKKIVGWIDKCIKKVIILNFGLKFSLYNVLDCRFLNVYQKNNSEEIRHTKHYISHANKKVIKQSNKKKKIYFWLTLQKVININMKNG